MKSITQSKATTVFHFFENLVLLLWSHNSVARLLIPCYHCRSQHHHHHHHYCRRDLKKMCSMVLCLLIVNANSKWMWVHLIFYLPANDSIWRFRIEQRCCNPKSRTCEHQRKNRAVNDNIVDIYPTPISVICTHLKPESTQRNETESESEPQ